MKKKLCSLLVVLVFILALSGCGCEHEWAEADCVNPKTCTLCGETEGAALGHVWLAADCDTPKTCEVCGTTEGEPKGHSWVEATCEEAKHCEACHVEEGEALGHTWLDATTEAPKTCETCAATEGERIVTDPRFTTASTLELQGKWKMQLAMTGEMMGLSDFPGEAVIDLIMVFENNGDLSVTVEITDAFIDAMVQYTEDLMYAELAAEGIDQETADAAFEESYGMTIHEYVVEQIGSVDFNTLYASIFDSMDLGCVYYVEDGQIYTGYGWDAEMEASGYTLEGDTLTIDAIVQEMEAVGFDGVLTRVTEE